MTSAKRHTHVRITAVRLTYMYTACHQISLKKLSSLTLGSWNVVASRLLEAVVLASGASIMLDTSVSAFLITSTGRKECS
jgi:hypothetical protein